MRLSPIRYFRIRRRRPGTRGASRLAGAARWALQLYIPIVVLAACASGDSPVSSLAKFPPVDLPPSGPPSYAVGDRFTYDNPQETWTVTGIRDGLVTWRSSLGAEQKTVFDPFVAPVEWSDDAGGGIERLVAWRDSLFPLTGGKKTAHRSIRRPHGQTPYPVEWKCYSGNPRKVTTAAGSYPAYPVLCRRSDDLTVQSFYAPEINMPLLITTRKRPAAAKTRALTGFALAAGGRVAAAPERGLPVGWAQAAVATPSDLERQTQVVARADTAPAAATAQAVPTEHENGRKPPPGPTAAPSVTVRPPAATPPADARRRSQPPSGHRAAVTPPTPSRGLAARPATQPAPKVATPKAATPKIPMGDSRYFGVQLAAYQERGNVEPGWSHYRARLRPLLDDVGHAVERADLGRRKGVFHRLIAGHFATRSGAESLCRSIRKRGLDCLVRPVGG